MDEIIDLHHQLRDRVHELRKLNEQKSPVRSRELSVAITELETGLLWLERHIAKAALDAESTPLPARSYYDVPKQKPIA